MYSWHGILALALRCYHKVEMVVGLERRTFGPSQLYAALIILYE